MTTTVVKSIGSAGGRDYSDIATWEADAPADLTAVDEVWKGECYNDSEFLVGSGISISGSTTDATRHKWLTAASGESFADNANALTNALGYDVTNGVGIRSTAGYITLFNIEAGEPYSVASRLQINYDTTSGGSPVVSMRGTLDQCIVQHSGTSAGSILRFNQGTSGSDEVVNCLLLATDSGSSGVSASYPGQQVALRNVTLVRPSDYAASGTAINNNSGYGAKFTVENCAVFGWATFANTTLNSASDYNATDLASAPGANSLTSLTYADQFEGTTSSAPDFRAKSAGALAAGTPDSDTGGIDIVGQTRDATTPTIGAWEIVSGGGGTTNYDFESGVSDFAGAVASSSALSGSIAQSSTYAHGGTYSAHVTSPDIDSGVTAALPGHIPADNTGGCDGWVYSHTGTGQAILALLDQSPSTPGYDDGWGVCLDYDNQVVSVWQYLVGAGASQGDAAATLAADAWYHAELLYDYGGAGKHRVEVYDASGTLLGGVTLGTAAMTPRGNMDRLALIGQDFYVDDVSYAGLVSSIDLAGDASAVATAAGALTVDIPLAGAAMTAVTAQGTLSAAIRLAGGAQVQASANGDLKVQVTLAGAAIAAASAAGGLTASGGQLGGAAQAAASGSGALSLQITLAGAALSEALASGALGSYTGQLGGHAQAQATAAGGLEVDIPLAGAAIAAADAEGGLHTDLELAGAAAAASSAIGALSTTLTFAGGAVVQALAGGDLRVTFTLGGAAVASAAARGTLYSDQYVPPPSERMALVWPESRMATVAPEERMLVA